MNTHATIAIPTASVADTRRMLDNARFAAIDRLCERERAAWHRARRAVDRVAERAERLWETDPDRAWRLIAYMQDRAERAERAYLLAREWAIVNLDAGDLVA